MARLTRLRGVSLFTRNLRRSREFYTRKVGLQVRGEDKRFGYLALGATKTGGDADLSVWQPARSWGEAFYRDGIRSIGTVAGIAFRTGNLAKTLEALSRRGVRVERSYDTFAKMWDLDGNILFLVEERGARRSGLQGISWVTVACRDEARTGRFFRTLGFRRQKVVGNDGEAYTHYRLGPRGTAILPFQPRREMYENPADYAADRAHIGELTGIGLEADDLLGLQEKLLARGVRFKERARAREWGASAARVYDPDRNHYLIVQRTR